MLLAALRRRDTPTGDLARVLAAWLMVILLVQGLAALQTLVRGPAHRHVVAAGFGATVPAREPMAAADPARDLVPSPVQVRVGDSMRHGPRLEGAAVSAASHERAHALGQPHHHGPGEPTLPADAEAGLDAAACVLMAALAAVAVSYRWAPRMLPGASVASVPWSFAEREVPPPRRPPRG